MNEFDRNNARLWKWGIFYYNPNDSNSIVPKRNGLGWTFNFAKRYTYLLLIAVINIIIFIHYIAK